MVRAGVDGFVAEAGIIGLQMIQDVSTRVEYMKMIRAEADEMLAAARRNRAAIQNIFNRIYERRNELRLVAQDKAKATRYFPS